MLKSAKKKSRDIKDHKKVDGAKNKRSSARLELARRTLLLPGRQIIVG
jgi:hypothetical protein